jgi:hypothetical protein
MLLLSHEWNLLHWTDELCNYCDPSLDSHFAADDNAAEN